MPEAERELVPRRIFVRSNDIFKFEAIELQMEARPRIWSKKVFGIRWRPMEDVDDAGRAQKRQADGSVDESRDVVDA